MIIVYYLARTYVSIYYVIQFIMIIMSCHVYMCSFPSTRSDFTSYWA